MDMIILRWQQYTRTSIANLYRMLALSTRAWFVSLRAGRPIGYSADLRGGGCGTPCLLSSELVGFSLARDEVPHGNPKCTAHSCGLDKMSHAMAWPKVPVRPSDTMGIAGLTTWWSMLITWNPVWETALDNEACPANSSTNNGHPNWCGTSSSARSQSV